MALTAYLAARGHEVVPLLRRAVQGKSSAIVWDWEAGHVREGVFEGFDAVIALAGESLIGRWTVRKRQCILRSRVVNTWLLAQMLAKVSKPPSLFMSASAVGFYANRGEELLTEQSEAGHSFLASLCVAWERAGQVMRDQGVRTVQARFGLVLDQKGGILPKLYRLVRCGCGGRWGSGEQWWSWVALADLMRAIEWILEHPSLEGPVNVVAPEAIRQQQMLHSLAVHCKCRVQMPLPAWLLRGCLGDAAQELLLSSARVYPARLLESGFHFLYPNVQEVWGL